MGIYGMMRTGVSGMNAQANRLTGVADNVANVSTAGYKRTDTQFSSLVMPSVRNAYQSGGVMTTVRHDITIQGVGRGTGRPGDIMLEGNGFFRVQDDSGTEFLTRAGSFRRDGDGYLRNAAGYYLLDDTGKRVLIKGGAGEILPGQQTANIDLATNLPADKPAIDRTKVAFDAANDKTYHLKKSVTVYDEQGVGRDVDLYFTKTADNTWEMRANINNGGNPPSFEDLGLTPQTLTFDKEGKLISPTNSPKINVPNFNQPATTFAVNINITGKDDKGFTGLTQFGSDFSFRAKQDGYAPGSYKDFTFGVNGEIEVSYSNSQVRQIGTVGLATVTAPDSLLPISGTVFQATPDAGAQIFGHPGEGTFGMLRNGMLEESNADIGDELTDMIEAQRNYTANSKVFQTGSEVMDVIVNLKR